ncbi:DUF748 domain-containing protein [Geobacter grbiciae]|uniref:DUF748 domain-containing protein n=1 Tax=Geobacter grbiciae TaxID=155042 RepID=UPI001C033BD4|nr:DUF748 domain-containing protein [Geobacter grbiciae]MBT1076943.1 DUF748 domain-containing protein [Geobacter grbiciae]
MKTWHKVLIGCGVFLVILAAFTAFILPGMVKGRAIRAVEESTGRKLSIGAVSINPVTWTAEVQGVRLTERDGTTTFASFSSARVAVSPASIFRGAPIVSEARLRSPYFHLVRTGANAYNFSDILEKKGPEKPEPKKERARFSISNIAVTNGSIDFIDQGLAVEKRHQVRGLELGVPFVSTIPHYADIYIAPRFRAVVNGSPLALDGKLRPFTSAAEYSLDVNLKDLDIPYYLAYVPAKLPVRVERGTAATKLALTYRIDTNKNPELVMSGDLSLANLKAAGADGAPLAALDRLGVVIGKSELLAPAISLSSVTLDGPVFHLARDGKGVWNVARLSTGEKPAPPPAEPKADPKEKAKGKPVVDVGEFTLRNGTVTVADGLPPRGFKAEAREIACTVRGFSTRPGKKADYSLSFATGRGESARITGDFSPEPVAASAMAELKGVVLDAFYPYLADTLTAPVTGKLDLSGQMTYDAAAGLSADKIAVRLTNLAAPFGPKEGARLARLDATGGRFSQKENRLEIVQVTLAGGDIRLSRDAAGNLSPLALVKKAEGTRRPAARESRSSVAKPFRYRIAAVAASGLDLTFTDRKAVGNPRFDLRRIGFNASNITGPRLETIPYRLTAGYGKGGALNASGSVTPSPLVAKGNLSLRRIPLTDFDAYLPEGLNIILADGALDTRLTYAVAKRGEGVGGTFAGNLGVRSFHCLDADADDLLTWDSLQLDKVSGSLDPFSLKIGEVSLAKFFSKIVIGKDGRLNLQKLYTPDQKGGDRGPGTGDRERPERQAGQPVQLAQVAQPAKPQRQIAIDTVILQEGTLAFSDHHMSRQYDTTFYNLGGRISGLSSEESRFADVDLRGNLQNLSPLQITGKLNPLRDDLYADITVRFADIDLTPLTPYSGTYVGYGIDRGKVSFDLKYTIENKQLNSENKVFIDQLTFGDRIESNKATSLPVRLAVALLKDRKGEIHLDIPVTGRTDDPQFSVWRVVWQIIKNLLVKAATSPFSLLQSAFGGKEDFSVIPFVAGSAHLAETEQAKLAKIAQALNDRPSLKVDIKGYVDKERDPEGYRVELLTRKMKAEKFLVLVKEKRNQPGDSAETMVIAPDEASRYLKAVYRKEKFPKPRNILGLEKDLPDAEMRKLILANTRVGEGELKALAAERAGAVKALLAGPGKVDPARLFLRADDIHKAPADKGPGSRVEFGAAVQ